MVKLLVLYRPPEDAAAFEDHFANWHLPLAAKIPFVQRFEAGRVLGAPDGDDSPYYRVAEFWFQSEETLHHALGTNEGRAAVADLPRFATGGFTIMVAEA
jgi:uncharacterized protein (TIGR02118 family)